ncbi:expressed secreted protein of unknown function [Candidatus Velamenicoccus archaeovorus]|uniref:Lipoprotein n=1 Tax=Velamenicoccus archaeovorus TaxID=1930593 RepID=A0A410P2T9_VELA1|nr:hypothetical protein [Candidatus Velamenicoccus archaeovorus]QAT16411.1 expressed secreted protein of unknown function [Candidatus Velamenicoccus archaeovorus]
MRSILMMLGVMFMSAGCANICEFGRSSDETKRVNCYGLMEQAKVGMMQAEVQKKIGYPDIRRYDISYMGKMYDEAWIYKLNSPPTILYFKNGVLQKKDYDYSQ